MYHLIITIFLLLCLLLYFIIAKKFKIIDKPNERSSHTQITIRGGGIIYPISFVCFLITLLFGDDSSSYVNYWIFGLGLIIISIISFIDDIMMLSSRVRIIFHFLCVTLLLYAINAFSLPFWAVALYYIFVIGIINSYNFMDGINGITGLYSLVALGTLYFVNENLNVFDTDFIIFPILASLVFLFFNFRKKAKCFAGDIGSFSISFWIITLIAGIIIYTGNYKYLLFLTVYGVDSVLTILERLKLKENIFDAHRRHLYQLLVNEKKQSHLLISFVYALIQMVVNYILISTDWSFGNYFLIIVIPLGISYTLFKVYLKKNLEQNTI
ncbi:UDP-GlcNAc--UDP-phosphate GlcNAc-1-phosphate transferase [Epilithonimonas xixisoli]|uniref:UDP-N-acetylmuramyl pentapeptide phosphotransferase/UDP-N-acetylglucosamine-1-phosphate transferase n=1 Tax=Epilithonimonas xixisoli TaxID=1476462 RepID=A0A4V3H2C7_9FLAO|nr:UDP-GlcNAc--UDP-phosphate GlcNAc-1-phosphate transferase [Epilithonimonas xixisoli]TDX83027.1 UDP-N-acetylmuramyl pentapeptide phosphotransferase/UDP-N-acetylglucosamine-1-phosphate transferase [Epilithonimonas xixisoli]